MTLKLPSETTCPHCGMLHATTCPLIRAIEYHPNGLVKRIEFHTRLGYSAEPDKWRDNGGLDMMRDYVRAKNGE